MFLRVYAVYDSAVGAFLQPFMARADAEASRNFLAAVQNNPAFNANHKDYSLWFLSEFNDATGEYGVPQGDKTRVPLQVMNGLQAIQAIQREQVPPMMRPREDLSDEAQLANGSGC